jgi:hypothetical protein
MGQYTLSSLSLGSSTPAATSLQVFGDIRVGDTLANGCVQAFDGSPLIGTCTSDRNLKENIVYLDSMLEKLSSLRVATYSWNDAAKDKYKYGSDTLITGIIAQDVEEIFPALVSVNKEGDKVVDTRPLTYYSLTALSELNTILGNPSASSTPEVFASSPFFKKILDTLAWFGVGIERGRVQVETLCINTTCITENELKQFLEYSKHTAEYAPTSASTPVATQTPLENTESLEDPLEEILVETQATSTGAQ